MCWGRLSTGWLLDRFPGPWVGFVLLLLASVGILLLPRASSLLAGCMAALLLGFGAEEDVQHDTLPAHTVLRTSLILHLVRLDLYFLCDCRLGTGPVLMGAMSLTGQVPTRRP